MYNLEIFCNLLSMPKTSRKRACGKSQMSSKMVVRNVPFEATDKELRELFR